MVCLPGRCVGSRRPFTGNGTGCVVLSATCSGAGEKASWLMGRWVGVAGPRVQTCRAGRLALLHWAACLLTTLQAPVCPTGEGPDLQVLWRCVMISRAFMAQMPQGTKANMLHAHLACLTRMEQVGNNWLFRSATFHFNQKAHPRRVVITPGFTNLSHSEIGKWVVGEIEVDV